MTHDSLLAAVRFRKIVAIVLLCVFVPIFIGIGFFALQAISIAIATPPLEVGPHFGTVLVGSLSGVIAQVIFCIVLLFKEVFGPPSEAIETENENKLNVLIGSLVANEDLSEETAKQIMEALNLKPFNQVRT